MKIFDMNVENWYTLAFKFNWVAIIVLLVMVWLLALAVRKLGKIINKKSMEFSGVNIGLGDTKITLVVNRKDQEIAYRIWVEMATRNIHDFDEENDVIIEIYNSWYQMFSTTRALLEEIPVSRLPYSKDLIDLVNDMLNKGLRPHLSRWQAKYRIWHKAHSGELDNMTPQEYQRTYPEYQKLVEDLLATNKIMLSYKSMMYEIAFR